MAHWKKKSNDGPRIDSIFRAYLSLVMLEERIEGKLPAREGIRIMKVRRIPAAKEARVAGADS